MTSPDLNKLAAELQPVVKIDMVACTITHHCARCGSHLPKYHDTALCDECRRRVSEAMYRRDDLYDRRLGSRQE